MEDSTEGSVHTINEMQEWLRGGGSFGLEFGKNGNHWVFPEEGGGGVWAFCGVWGVSITCMQTNVQWPAYEAPRYPLWPSELARPSPAILLRRTRRRLAARSRRSRNLQKSIFCFCFSLLVLFLFIYLFFFFVVCFCVLRVGGGILFLFFLIACINIYINIFAETEREREREENMFIYIPIFGWHTNRKLKLNSIKNRKKWRIFASGHVQQKQNRTKTKYSFNKKRGVEEKKRVKIKLIINLNKLTR